MPQRCLRCARLGVVKRTLQRIAFKGGFNYDSQSVGVVVPFTISLCIFLPAPVQEQSGIFSLKPK